MITLVQGTTRSAAIAGRSGNECLMSFCVTGPIHGAGSQFGHKSTAWHGSRYGFGLNQQPNIMHQEHNDCIQACQTCANECEHCATACLGEADVKMMADCIQLDRYCADLCRMAASFMARADGKFGDSIAHRLCALCAEICDECATECRKHDNEHCKRCAEACEACAKACREMGVAELTHN